MNENAEMENSVPEAILEAPTEVAGADALAEPDVSDAPCEQDAALESVEALADEPVPPSPAEDPDPDPLPPPADATLLRMEALERELTALRRDLEERQAEMLRVTADYEEFCSLYPDVSTEALPDAVWSDVERGIPLAAAFALAERKALLLEKKAALCNSENQKRSAGSLAGTENNFFSIGEVRAMSRAEVRQNYQKIIQSMKKWH